MSEQNPSQKSPEQVFAQTQHIVNKLRRRGLSLTGATEGPVRLPETQSSINRELHVENNGFDSLKYKRTSHGTDKPMEVSTYVSYDRRGVSVGVGKKVKQELVDNEVSVNTLNASASVPAMVLGSYTRTTKEPDHFGKLVEQRYREERSDAENIQTLAQGLGEIRGAMAEAALAQKHATIQTQPAPQNAQDVLNLK